MAGLVIARGKDRANPPKPYIGSAIGWSSGSALEMANHTVFLVWNYSEICWIAAGHYICKLCCLSQLSIGQWQKLLSLDGDGQGIWRKEGSHWWTDDTSDKESAHCFFLPFPLYPNTLVFGWSVLYFIYIYFFLSIVVGDASVYMLSWFWPLKTCFCIMLSKFITWAPFCPSGLDNSVGRGQSSHYKVMGSITALSTYSLLAGSVLV